MAMRDPDRESKEFRRLRERTINPVFEEVTRKLNKEYNCVIVDNYDDGLDEVRKPGLTLVVELRESVDPDPIFQVRYKQITDDIDIYRKTTYCEGFFRQGIPLRDVNRHVIWEDIFRWLEEAEPKAAALLR